MAGLAHFSLPALAAVMATGALTVAAASWLRRHRPLRPARQVRGLGPWVIVLSALVAWEAVAFSLSPRQTHPTLSSIADAALGPRPVEAAAFLLWLALGWRLARR